MKWSAKCVRHGLKRLLSEGGGWRQAHGCFNDKIFINGSEIKRNQKQVMSDFIRNHYERGHGRYCIFYLSIASTQPKRHANVLLFDTKEWTYSIFDPRGLEFGWEKFPSSLQALDAWIHSEFGGNGIRFKPLEWDLRPQETVMERNNVGKGLCSFWALWWIDRIITEGKPPKKVTKHHWKHLHQALSHPIG